MLTRLSGHKYLLLTPLVLAAVLAGLGAGPRGGRRTADGYLHEGVAGGIGLFLFFRGIAELRRKRLIDDIPTSKVRSAAMGPCELQGFAREHSPLRSPYSGTPCVFCRHRLEKEVRDSRGHRHWEIIREESTTNYFYLEDATGRMLIDPLGCESMLAMDYRNTDDSGIGRRRYTEWLLKPGEPVYVLGTVGRFRDMAADRRTQLNDALRRLKADAGRLNSFDADNDGRIDAEEWDRARAVVEEELAAADLASTARAGDDLVTARGETETVFIISDQDEKSLGKRIALRCAASAAGGFLLTAAMAGSLLARAGLLSPHLAIPWELLYR